LLLQEPTLVVFHGVKMIIPVSSLRRSEVWLCDAIISREDGHALYGSEGDCGKDPACYDRARTVAML